MTLVLEDCGPEFDEMEASPDGLFPNLRPGDYRLFGHMPVNGDDVREFGFFTVVAGQRQEFEVKLPAGALEVTVLAKGRFERLETLCIGLEAEQNRQSPSGLRVWLPPVARKEGGTIWKTTIVALGAGTYRLKMQHRRLKTVEQLVTIGADEAIPAELRLTLEPK